MQTGILCLEAQQAFMLCRMEVAHCETVTVSSNYELLVRVDCRSNAFYARDSLCFANTAFYAFQKRGSSP